jgi:NAD(P)-dependent dehydrogenase (short-subunit alcohol dehydrogenase family)
VRSLADLERSLNIRVNAVAPGRVKTPLWTADKLEWVDEDAEPWVTTEKVAQTMLDLVTKPENVGGTVLEVGVDVVRSVQELNDPGPQGRGHAAKNVAAAVKNVYGLIEENFGV